MEITITNFQWDYEGWIFLILSFSRARVENSNFTTMVKKNPGDVCIHRF